MRKILLLFSCGFLVVSGATIVMAGYNFGHDYFNQSGIETYVVFLVSIISFCIFLFLIKRATNVSILKLTPFLLFLGGAFLGGIILSKSEELNTVIQLSILFVMLNIFGGWAAIKLKKILKIKGVRAL